MSKIFLKRVIMMPLCLLIAVFMTGGHALAISFPIKSMNISLGKKVLLKPNGCSSNVSWSTNNPNIARVEGGGFVSAVGVGRAIITARDASNGCTASFTLNVVPKEHVRFTYVTPNTCNPNTEVSVYATTESYVESMKFEVEHNGRVATVPAVERFVEGNVHVWRGKFRVSDCGIYNVRGYSFVSGAWHTCNNAVAEVLAKHIPNKSDCAYGERRISDEGLRFIASCEGFCANVYKDALAHGIPTLAHGYVIKPYVPYYTGLSRREGMALLIRAINKGSFSINLNRLLIRNNIMFSQQQFDSLVSFTYNLGPGWMNINSGLRNVLLNCGGGPAGLVGTVNSGNGINIRSGPGVNHKIVGTLRNNYQVQILDRNKINGNWYKIKTSNGLIGYCCSDYLIMTERAAGVKNLNNVNRNGLINNMSIYHHVSGKCCKGLLTRRFWELDIFLYGEYGINGGYSSRHPNRHNYPIPRCVSGR